MAHALRKLVYLGSSASVSYVLYNKHKASIQGLRAFSPWGTSSRCNYSVGADQTGYNVALSSCTIGDSCVIHNGVCIGQDGFGFFVDENGNILKKPQLLNARIGNHVEIGANTCIDRGSWRDTVVGDHSKIDNLVQIGHNVVMGRSCMLCGQVGIAGSVTIGDYVTFGGRVAVRDHVSIVSKVRLAATSCVTKDIKEPGDYGGFPAVPVHEWRRQVATQLRTMQKNIGDYVTFGGRVAVRDHVSIVSKVRLAATSCVTKDIKEPGDYGSFPAVTVHEWRRQVATQLRTMQKKSHYDLYDDL
ncbi:putative UDP-3-O-acylglucosamine N-acyltransferase 2, mitochondrial [Morella rubra]|uniref:Putative UDP-3-O-acylglucosamine N-acyltransferase 2, mitochondrial n=1 Tax=Morella rubra TaxID=262757 RepID=A0A6A1UQG3_9ROSI|nr:putative UDP-3-O-acylglucosamine N-acyltransferase 2, mitochondrial [Morella rubra]